MIAYNKVWLNNLFTRQEASIAFYENCITAEENDNIRNAHPLYFYSPNIFIRVGLFVLTNIIMLFAFGLIGLIFLNQIEHFIAGIAVFFAILTYAALEYMVQRKNHYRSGVDDALLWGAAIALFCGISFNYNLGSLANCVLIFIIALFFTIRFADRLMAISTFLSCLGILFFLCTKAGDTGKAIVPFFLMAFSLMGYVLMKKLGYDKTFSVYDGCFELVGIISLFTLYSAGNYWVVRELSNSMFNLHLQPEESIPYGWIFWILTAMIPLLYLFLGIKKKDVVLLRCGLLLVTAIVFTVRFYHAVFPAEIAMLIGGVALILFAYVLTRYLSVPRYGFTKEELNSLHQAGNMQIESLILAETFSQQPESNGGTNFGGGNFGGGGASGEF